MKAERDWEMSEKLPAEPSHVLLSTTEYREFGFRAQGPAEWESMEGVNLSLSCSLDQVGIHIELIQPSKRPSSAFHCKGSVGESPCLSTHWDF